MSSMYFVTFSFGANVPQFRGIVCAILLLAPVNFRWSATQLLPSVRYLTRLDEYGIGCLIFSVFIMSWNGIIGSSVITTQLVDKKFFDTIAVMVLGTCFLIFNLYYLLKLIHLYLQRRIVQQKLEPKIILSKMKMPNSLTRAKIGKVLKQFETNSKSPVNWL